MANHGLLDFGTTITLSKSEYEALVRDSECLEILRQLFTNSLEIKNETIKTILGLEHIKESEDK